MSKKRKQTLNEEQLAQAAKEGGEIGGVVYVVRPKNDPLSKAKPKPEGSTYVEAPSFFAARAFGCRILGVSEVTIATADSVSRLLVAYPRWELRWAGNAAGSPNTRRLQARLLPHGAYGSAIAKGEKPPAWKDVSEL